ncbi:MAG TPA: helix-turn-helix domain-containing protein [Solirubrobacterales bacterium]|nr:helix-turn-helix domain-containing protein [Solirubrobacterales bacterium]
MRDLGQLCHDLGPGLLEPSTAPRGLEIPISGVLLHDFGEEIAEEEMSERLVLAVGEPPRGEALRALVTKVAAAGAAGIACRDGDTWREEMRELGETHQLAILSVPPQIRWGELYDLIGATIATPASGSTTELLGRYSPDRDDLTALADTLATIVGGPVGIEDTHAQMLAFSGAEGSDAMRKESILSRKVPDRWLRKVRERGVYDELQKSDDVVHVSFDDLPPRRAIAVRLGKNVLGSIWVAGTDDVLSTETDTALRRAAPMVAAQMMRERLTLSVERRMRESALASLLKEGEPSPRALAQLGLPPDQPLVVLAVEATPRSDNGQSTVGPRLVDALTRHLQAQDRVAVGTALWNPAARTPGQERVYLLACARSGRDLDELRRIAGDACRRATKLLGADTRCGLGRLVVPPEPLSLGRLSAEDCLEHSPPGGDPVVAFDEVRDRALLGEVDRVVDTWRGGPPAALQALVDHDAANGTEYVRTLRCMLESFGQAPLVAERLHLHVNSARHRMKRVIEISGIDLTDGDARLALELAVRSRSSGDLTP